MTRPSQDPTYEAPKTATVGETLVWLVRGDSTPSNDGWALTVQLTPSVGSVQTITGAQEGSGPDFRVTVPVGTTTTLGAGTVRYSAMAAKSGEALSLGRGMFELLTDSGLSAEEEEYRALDAALAQFALAGVQEYSAAGRVFRKTEESVYKKRLATLAQRIWRKNNGGVFVRQHMARF